MKQKSIKLNFIMNVLLTVSSFIFPIITFPYVSRILEPAGLGKVTVATSFISYFVMVSQFGIPTYGIRACAKVRDDRIALTKTVHELLAINCIMSIIAYAAFFVMLAFVPQLRQEKALYCIVSLSVLFNTLGMEWLYKALEHYTYITIRSVVFKLIAAFLMFGLIHNSDDYIIYGAISIFAASASNVMNFVHAHKYIGMKPVGDYHLRPHIKAVTIFFLMACATTIYTNLDAVMLGFMTTDADVGYYDAAVKVKSVLVGIVTSLGAVLLPRVSYYAQNAQMEEFKAIAKKALNFVFLFALPLMIYFMLFARQSVYILAGGAYEASILPMRIIMPSVFLIGVTNILGIQILVPLGREKYVLYSEIAGAVVNIIINLLLIPRFAAIGAAVGTLAAEAVVLTVQLIALRKARGVLFTSVHYVKIVIALCLSAAASVWTPKLGLSNIMTMVLSATLFFGVYGAFMLITREALVTETLAQCVGIIKEKFSKK